MYYLRSITLNCGIKVLPDRLLDYPHWSRLVCIGTRQVYGQAYMWSPDELWESSSSTMRTMTSQPPYNGRFLTLS